MLAQIELALVLRELALHLRLNASAQLHQFQFAREMAMDFVEARAPVGLFEQLLPLGMAQGGQIAGDEIGQRPGSVMSSAVDDEIVGEIRARR